MSSLQLYSSCRLGFSHATFPPRTLLYLELPAKGSLLFPGIAAKFSQAAANGACMLDHNKLAGTLQIIEHELASAARFSSNTRQQSRQQGP